MSIPPAATRPADPAPATSERSAPGGGRSLRVVLADRTMMDIGGLNPEELDRLQWDQERAYAGQIKRSAPGSDARARAMRDGYDTISKILGLRRGGDGGVRMGSSPRYARLAASLLRAQRERGVADPRFFEIGYGSGEVLAAVAAQGFEVAGIDVSPHLREQTLVRVPACDAGRLLVGNFATHPCAGDDSSFDVLYWNDVLEHVPTDESDVCLRKACSLLRPGGALLTITPNWHVRPSDVTARYLPPRSEARGFHLKEYTLRELRGRLGKAGFERVATPLLATHARTILLGRGLCAPKCLLEPALEWMPFRLARLLCRGLAMNCTIAWKPA